MAKPNKRSTKSALRCEGYRRYRGAFAFGPVKWVQCEESALVVLKVKQDDEVKSFPACMECWGESQNSGIVLSAIPLKEAGDAKAE